MKNRVVIWIIFTLFVLLTACTLLQKHFPTGPPRKRPHDSISENGTIKKILSHYDRYQKYPGLTIHYPYTESIFPPELASPTFIWQDMNPASNHWLIVVEFNRKQQPIHRLVNEKKWTPENHLWERIKTNSISVPAGVSILGINNKNECEIASSDTIHFKTSKDKVESSVFFRQVPLPFKTASKSFEKTRWRLGDISSYDNPVVVMEKIPVCASCHLFSKDGKTISMEMNYNNDSGAHFIAPVTEHIRLSKRNFFSWNDFPRQGALPPSRGLFAKMSPTGRYVVSTINEISYAVIFKQIDFSQLFFPTYGVLGIYDVETKKFYLLPGADDYDFVQTNPNWSPDEKYVVYARAKTKNEIHEDILNIKTVYDNTDIHALNKKNNIQFDLYRVAFNQGKGGRPVPLEGASNNDMSNYFPRYSPDGKWLVFTQSKTGIMLQPDSQLFIIPAGGGIARKMRCNQSLFNSWHSWSSNSKWLLFSSKVNSPYTEIFLTHVDDEGNDSPPVLLSRFSEVGYAANVPEFVNIKPDAIHNISLIDHK
jgi:hypothetical protein